jgi:hypothetical protein
MQCCARFLNFLFQPNFVINNPEPQLNRRQIIAIYIAKNTYFPNITVEVITMDIAGLWASHSDGVITPFVMNGFQYSLICFGVKQSLCP